MISSSIVTGVVVVVVVLIVIIAIYSSSSSSRRVEPIWYTVVVGVSRPEKRWRQTSTRGRVAWEARPPSSHYYWYYWYSYYYWYYSLNFIGLLKSTYIVVVVVVTDQSVSEWWRTKASANGPKRQWLELDAGILGISLGIVEEDDDTVEATCCRW